VVSLAVTLEARMKKLLNPNQHGVLDYVLGGAFLVAPALFSWRPVPTITSYGLGIAQIGMSLFTKYPLGLVKLIPFKVHGAIEMTTALQIIAMPKMLNFKQMCATSFYVTAGLGLLAVWAVTDYSQAAVDAAQIEADELEMETERLAQQAAQEAKDIIERGVEQVEEVIYKDRRAS
jgi:hypothetical protein